MRSWSAPVRPARRTVAGVGLSLALLLTGCSAGGSAPAVSATAGTPAVPTAATSSQPASPSTAAGEASAPKSSRVPLLPGAVSDAPAPDPDALAAELDEILAGSPGTVGAAVVDVQTGELLYGLEEDEPLIPASTVKILTATAALSVLGSDHTYATRTYAVPQEQGTTVVLDAGGDVLLGAGESDPGAVLGRAGLGTLAEQTVAQLQEQEISGPVTVQVDDSGYDGPAVLEQWPSAVVDVDIARVMPIATYGGREIGQKWGGLTPDPALHAAQVFRQQLVAQAQSQGVRLSVSPQIARGAVEDLDRTGSSTRTALRLAEVRSAPLAEQVRFMLHESDNLTAEAMARNTALAAGHPGSFAGGAAAVREVLEAETQDLAGLELTDGSGLSGYTTITAEQLARTVRLAGRSERTVAAVQGLPLAGQEGTLENRMAGTAAEGRARGKTGTLGSVATLAGVVVTADGRELAYSILTNGQRGRIPQARTMIDRAVVTLAECGCGGD